MLPFRWCLFQGRTCIFHQDNVKPHTASITTEGLCCIKCWCWTGLPAVQNFHQDCWGAGVHQQQFSASDRPTQFLDVTFSVLCLSGGDAQRGSPTAAAVHTHQRTLTSPGLLPSHPSRVPPPTGMQLLPWRWQKGAALTPWWTKSATAMAWGVSHLFFLFLIAHWIRL